MTAPKLLCFQVSEGAEGQGALGAISSWLSGLERAIPSIIFSLHRLGRNPKH